ncbi:MAG: LysR family transcriptional regulator [Actinobacteria bacterium]|nr:LysR family transcriptional regulator [Actinomycetota bacterium]
MVTLDPRRLLVLATVSDRGGVVAAADTLHLTPSAVSQQLVRLEREAGVALVDRSRRQARLTIAGERLADHGRRIANELLAAEADVAQWTGASGTTVTVAGFATIIKRLIVPLIGQLDIGHQIGVRVVERDGRLAVADLHAGQVDIVLAEVTGTGTLTTDPQAPRNGEGPSTAQLRTALILEDAYRIAVPADWPAQDWLDGGVIVDELTRHPWIAASRGSATHSALTRLTAAWRFTPRTDHECSELSSVVSLVAGGLGAAVIPQLAWADAAERTQLLDTDSVDAAAGISSGLGVRRIAALVRSTRRRVPAIELFLAALQRAADAEQMGIGTT